jgi:hypothetical protein
MNSGKTHELSPVLMDYSCIISCEPSQVINILIYIMSLDLFVMSLQPFLNCPGPTDAVGKAATPWEKKLKASARSVRIAGIS